MRAVTYYLQLALKQFIIHRTDYNCKSGYKLEEARQHLFLLVIYLYTLTFIIY